MGPYARLREGTILKENTKIGNFVETKKSKVSKNSKVNHLSYIGDTSIGKNSNIGAGTITCNYDGAKKSKTKISDNVFVGSNSSLVAPVKLEKNSSIWFNAVLRGDIEFITIGENSNVQDGSVLHTDPGYKLNVGKGVTIGHMVMLHGCKILDDTLIGATSEVFDPIKTLSDILVFDFLAPS